MKEQLTRYQSTEEIKYTENVRDKETKLDATQYGRKTQANNREKSKAFEHDRKLMKIKIDLLRIRIRESD